MQAAVVNGVDAIKAETEAYHVEVAFGKALDAGTVANVAQYFVGEGALQLLRSLVKSWN